MQEPALLSDFFIVKIQLLSQKDSNKTPNKFSQQDSGPASVILNSDELGRRRGNNQTNCDLTNGFFLLLNLVVVPALSNLLTWREWEIIMISPNCRRAIIWHIGCYGSDWLFSHCSCEDAAGSFCHIKRWKQFQKINSWIIKQAPVWSEKLWIRGRNIEGIAGVSRCESVWDWPQTSCHQMSSSFLELKVATWRIVAACRI